MFKIFIIDIVLYLPKFHYERLINGIIFNHLFLV